MVIEGQLPSDLRRARISGAKRIQATITTTRPPVTANHDHFDQCIGRDSVIGRALLRKGYGAELVKGRLGEKNGSLRRERNAA